MPPRALILLGGLAVAGWGLLAAQPDVPLWLSVPATAGVVAVAVGALRSSRQPVVRPDPVSTLSPPWDDPQWLDVLGLLADVHLVWDRSGELQRMALHSAEAGMRWMPVPVAQPVWALPGLQLEASALHQWQSATRTEGPIEDLLVHWRERPDGPLRPMRLTARPMRDGHGRVVAHQGLLRDASAAVAARAALAASEDRLHDLFRRIPLGLVLHRTGRVLDANPAAVALLGAPDLHSLLGRDWLDQLADADAREALRQTLVDLLGQALGTALPESEHALRNGQGVPLMLRISHVRVDADRQPATLSILADDTQRRQAEEAVRRSEALLSHLVATSPDVITLTELSTGRYAMVNPTFLRVTGYRIEEVLGHTAQELDIWAWPEERQHMVQQLREHGAVQSMPAQFKMRDGRLLLMQLSASRFAVDGRDYLVITARDITALEQARLEREAILDNAQIGIAMTRDRRFTLVNPRFEQMLGWGSGELDGRDTACVWPSPADHEEVGEAVAPNLGRGQQVELERPLRRKDGSVFLCRLLAKAVDPGHPSRGGTIWLAEDVTERRQIEQALAQARDDAEAANRAKSAFLASTSHEIRTPLNALLGLAQLARQPDLDDVRRRQYIEQIGDSAETLSAILSDILDLSKIEAGKMHLDNMVFDLHALLDSLRQAYGSLADAAGLRLMVEEEGALPQAVSGDPVRVRQILSNFLGNALKFTRQGQIRLVTRTVHGPVRRFEVFDTGPGIDLEAQARLFKPFVQGDSTLTRRVGGSGLGLSICRELATLMGGEVGVVSVPGQGSCFWAELPLPEAEVEELDAGASAYGVDPIAGARVLMVEDNAVNMMIAVALLQQWGAEVGQATDGASALRAVEAAAEQGRPFQAVLMDVQMPDLSGHQVAARLRRRWDAQQLPIIALTAAALVSERERALAAGMNDFLTKPIDAGRLRQALARVLHQAA